MSATFSPDDPHPCVIGRNDDGTLEYEHEWTLKHDWFGDPGVINGTCSICWMECDNCGERREPTDDERRVDDYEPEDFR